MADFDMPGLGKARTALTSLAQNPARKGNDEIKRALIKDLYTEIRAARIAGHTWRSIRVAILSNMNLKISEGFLMEAFIEQDKRYEKETGIKALPVRRYDKAKKKERTEV